MKTGKKPGTLMIAIYSGALILILGSLASSLLRRVGVIEPRIWVEATTSGGGTRANAQAAQYRALYNAMNGETASTGERLRDATTLVGAAGLVMAIEQGRTANLLNRIVDLNLLVPGLTVGERSMLASSHGTFLLRWRQRPIGVEVISIGNSKSSGPALLVRAPADEQMNGTAIWQSESLEEIVVPRPFASMAELVSAGWGPSNTLPSVQ